MARQGAGFNPLHSFTGLLRCQTEKTSMLSAHFMDSCFQIWLCKNTQYVQDSINLFTLVHLPEEYGQILENYNYFLLFIPPDPTQYPSPFAFDTFSFMAVYVHLIGFQHLQQEFTGSMPGWWSCHSHGKLSTGCHRSWLLPGQPVTHPQKHSAPRPRHCWGAAGRGWGSGVKSGTFWPDSLLWVHVFCVACEHPLTTSKS